MGVEIAIGVAVGAVIGGAAAGIQSGGNFDAIWKGALVGAVGGAVGGWAAPALSGAISGTASGVISTAGAIAAGGLGGATSGLLSTALNGGTGDDYWKNTLIGGALGATTAGVTRAAGIFGANGELAPTVSGTEGAPVVPTDASGIPLTSQGAYAFDDAAQAASGVGNVGSGSEVINTSVTGATAQPTPSYTAPQLSDTVNAAANVQSLDSGVANPNVMTQGVEAPQGSFGTSFDTSVAPTNYDAAGIPTTSNGQYAFDDAAQGTSLGNTVSTPKATATDYSTMTDQYGNKYSDLYGDKFQKAMEAGAAGKSYDPENYIGRNAMGWGERLNYGLENVFGKTGADTMKALGKGMMISQGLKGVGALLGQNEARQNQRQLMDLYNQQNAYMQQQQGQNAQAFQQNLAANTQNQQAFRDQLNAAQGYNTQLQGTYEDPNSYLSSPEAQATRSLAMQKLLAQNAMAGRRSSGLAMQNQLMANQLQNLAAYRQGLRQSIQYPNQLAGMQYQNADAATNAKILAAAQSQSPTGNLMAGLGSMFAPAATYYLMG